MKRFIIYFFLLMSIFLFGSCAGTRNGSNGSEEEAWQEGSYDVESSEEAEVLRLLGIKDEQAPTEIDQPEDTSAQPTNWQELEREVQQLEQKLDQKDAEISSLRQKMRETQMEINEKEETLESKTPRTTSTPSSHSGETGSMSFKEKYNQALGLYRAREYQAALDRFKALLASGEQNSLTDNCQYWIGECHYALRNYNQALLEFNKVFSFPNSNKWDDAQLKLGKCYMELGQTEQAKVEFNKLIDEYPESEYVSEARRFLSRL